MRQEWYALERLRGHGGSRGGAVGGGAEHGSRCAVRCGAVRCGAVRCGAVQCGAPPLALLTQAGGANENDDQSTKRNKGGARAQASTPLTAVRAYTQGQSKVFLPARARGGRGIFQVEGLLLPGACRACGRWARRAASPTRAATHVHGTCSCPAHPLALGVLGRDCVLCSLRLSLRVVLFVLYVLCALACKARANACVGLCWPRALALAPGRRTTNKQSLRCLCLALATVRPTMVVASPATPRPPPRLPLTACHSGAAVAAVAAVALSFCCAGRSTEAIASRGAGRYIARGLSSPGSRRPGWLPALPSFLASHAPESRSFVLPFFLCNSEAWPAPDCSPLPFTSHSLPLPSTSHSLPLLPTAPDCVRPG